MGALTASVNLSTTIAGGTTTQNVVDATSTPTTTGGSTNLGTDTVTWTVGGGAVAIGYTISTTTSNCSVSPSSQTMANSVQFTVNNFSGSSYSVTAQVTNTENFTTYYAKLQGSVSGATYSLDEANGDSNLGEDTAYAFDWTSNYTLNSGSLFQNNTRFQEAAASLGTGASIGTINLTTNDISNNTASAAVTLRTGGTGGAIVARWDGTVYNAPGTPTNATFSSRTETSITVTGVAGTPDAGTLQVKLGTGGAWQNSPHNFTGLTHTTSYDFYVQQVNGPATSATGGPFAGATLDATPSGALELGGFKGSATRNIYYYASCVAGNAPVTSEGSAGSYTVAGIEAGANVQLSRTLSGGLATAGQHKVNSGSWTSSATQLVNGDSVKFRVLASSSYATAVKYTWTVENLNSDSLQITTEPTPDAPGAPTNISFTPTTTASNNITVAVTASGGTGTIDSTSVRQGNSGSYSANGTSFAAVRGSSQQYQAINSNDGGDSVAYSENYAPPYLATDTTINAVGNVTLNYTDTSFSRTISPAESNQVYQLRTGSATGDLRADSAIGSGAITCTEGLPAPGDPPGSPVTYYVTTWRTTGSGGGGETNFEDTGRTFTVSRSAGDDTPNAFDSDLGPDLNGVGISTGNYESDEAVITGLQIAADISITGGSYRIKPSGEPSFDAWTNATVDDGFPVGGTIQIRGAASTSYSTSTTVTVTIGGVSGTIVITTEADPNPGGGDSGGGGTGTYGLRTFDTSGNISLDISDRVFVEAVQGSYTFGVSELTKNIDIDPSSLGIEGNRVIWTNPPTSVLDGTTGAPKEDILIELAVSGSTLTLSRQASGSTPTVNYIVVKDD